MDWKLVSAELILRRRIFNVWQQRRRSPRTGQEHDFDVLETSDWVNVVPVTPDRRVVLVRQFRHGIGQTTLEVPAGLIDPEDVSPTHAGARELREEIGLGAFRTERLLGVYHDTVTLKDDHVVAYVVRTDEASPPLETADPFEIQAVAWFALDSVPDDLSPATARRIAEFKAGVTGGGAW